LLNLIEIHGKREGEKTRKRKAGGGGRAFVDEQVSQAAGPVREAGVELSWLADVRARLYSE